MNKIITIMIPVYNEEESLTILYTRLVNVLNKIEYGYEILFINDGSYDGSLEIIKALRKINSKVSYINLSRNYGKEIAMAAGFDYFAGDALVIMDADLQDPPELIPEMIDYWEQGFDDVYAKRKSRNGETWLKKKTAYYFYRFLKFISRIPIQEDTGDFRLISKRVVEALKQFKEIHRYTKGYFSLIGFNKKEILYDRDPRIAGKSKWSYFKLIDLAVEGITSYSNSPLKISTYIGFAVAIFSFIYMIYIILKTLIFGERVAGYPSLICVILFMGGIQLICIGIIGEYLGRVFSETKNRPLYFIDEINGEKLISKY